MIILPAETVNLEFLDKWLLMPLVFFRCFCNY